MALTDFSRTDAKDPYAGQNDPKTRSTLAVTFHPSPRPNHRVLELQFEGMPGLQPAWQVKKRFLEHVAVSTSAPKYEEVCFYNEEQRPIADSSARWAGQ